MVWQWKERYAGGISIYINIYIYIIFHCCLYIFVKQGQVFIFFQIYVYPYVSFFIFFYIFQCVYNSGSRKKKQINFMTQSSSLSNRIYHKKYVYRYRYVRYIYYIVLFQLSLWLVLAITIIIMKNHYTKVAGEKLFDDKTAKNAGNNTKNSLANDSHDVWGIFIVFIFHFKNIHTHPIIQYLIDNSHLFVMKKKLYMAIEITMEICSTKSHITLNSDKFLNVILSKLNEVKNSSEENIKQHSFIHFIFCLCDKILWSLIPISLLMFKCILLRYVHMYV